MPKGRKRKNGRRYRNGELAEPTTRKERRDLVDMTTVVKDARHRVHGVPKELAGHQYAGDALGRLALAGQERGGISLQQREAGELYASIVATYEMYLAGPLVARGELGRVRGHDDSPGDEPDYVARYERAKGRYGRAVRCVSMQHDRLALGVLNQVVLHDREDWGDIGSLRTALNAIGHEFREELTRGGAAT